MFNLQVGLSFLDDIFGAGKIADAVKVGEWIAAIFAGLAWAFGHPSTACWGVGALLVFAVLRKGFPFSNVPDIGTFLGKALAIVGLVLIVGGFTWRAADEVFGVRAPVAESHGKPPSAHSQPVPGQGPSGRPGPVIERG